MDRKKVSSPYANATRKVNTAKPVIRGVLEAQCSHEKRKKMVQYNKADSFPFSFIRPLMRLTQTAKNWKSKYLIGSMPRRTKQRNFASRIRGTQESFRNDDGDEDDDEDGRRNDDDEFIMNEEIPASSLALEALGTRRISKQVDGPRVSRLCGSILWCSLHRCGGCRKESVVNEKGIYTHTHAQGIERGGTWAPGWRSSAYTRRKIHDKSCQGRKARVRNRVRKGERM